MSTLPSKLLINGILWLRVGPTRGNGICYTSALTGETLEAFPGTVTQRSPNGSRVCVPSHPALGSVEVPPAVAAAAGNPGVGQPVLVEVQWPGPRARQAWALGAIGADASAPMPSRSTARPPTVQPRRAANLKEWKVDRGFGRLVDDRGQSFFCHAASFRSNTVPVLHSRYQFAVNLDNPRGPEAVEIVAL